MGAKVATRGLCVLVACLGLLIPSARAVAQEEAGEGTAAASSGDSDAKGTAPSSAPAAKIPAQAVGTAPEATPEASEELIAKRKRGNVRVGVFVGYGFGRELKFNQARYPIGAPADQTSELGYEVGPAPVVGVELMVPGFNQWGALFGFAADINREVKDYNFKSPSGTAPASGLAPLDGTKLSIYSVYFNIFYRFSKFYIPFGLSYSMVSVSKPNKALEGLQGDLGGQVGAGVFIFDGLALEWTLRVQGLKGVEHNDLSGGDSIDAREGSIWNNTLVAKAYF